MSDQVVDFLKSNYSFSSSLNVTFVSNIHSLSSSLVYKIVSCNQIFALKSYEISMYPSLSWSHQVLEKIRRDGFHLFPEVVRSKKKNTIERHQNCCWDLSGWMNGSVPEPTLSNLSKMIVSLAEFHLKVGKVYSSHGEIPGWKKRLNEYRKLSILDFNHDSHFFLPNLKLSSLFKWLKNELDWLSCIPLPFANNQICWGDARRENSLIENGEICGFIDYGSFRIDAREVDVCRMISSFAEDDFLMWEKSLKIYSSIVPVNFLACRILDLLGTAISLFRWIKWFKSPGKIKNQESGIKRINELLQRIEKWKEHGSLKSMLFFD